MEEKKFFCPCCNRDITADVELYIKQKKAAYMRSKITPEKRAELNHASAERMREWRKNNPEAVRQVALKASSSRTEETFAKQRDTIKKTIQRKAVVFAELLFEAKNNNRTITPELEIELMQKAKNIVKAENKAAKKSAKVQ